MTILLVCTAGMSTSMLVKRMQKAASDRDLDIQIMALPATNAIDETTDLDLSAILVGPQAAFTFDKLQIYAEEKNCPIEVISPQLYGTFSGEKVLDYALDLIARDQKNGSAH